MSLHDFKDQTRQHIRGSCCLVLWLLALLLNGLALLKGQQPPTSWLAFAQDELIAGGLLAPWLLLAWWRRGLWLVGALLLIGALWLASWL
jgi:hypothetical protein